MSTITAKFFGQITTAQKALTVTSTKLLSIQTLGHYHKTEKTGTSLKKERLSHSIVLDMNSLVPLGVVNDSNAYCPERLSRAHRRL